MNKIVYNAEYGGFSLTKQEIEYYNNYCKEHNLKGTIDEEDWFADISRHHPALVATVEHFKDYKEQEKKILEIEDDEYYIQDYDGLERVITKDDFVKIKDGEFNEIHL